MQADLRPSPARRTTAAALKQQVLAYLDAALPPGWISQPLNRQGPTPAADVLIISPRGRCHFLFVHAPADRWWDGGPHSVPAERFPAAEARLARQLRAAGHRARAIWTAQDLARALTSWGCPHSGPVRLGAEGETAPLSRRGATRPRLHLSGWEPRDHG